MEKNFLIKGISLLLVVTSLVCPVSIAHGALDNDVCPAEYTQRSSSDNSAARRIAQRVNSRSKDSNNNAAKSAAREQKTSNASSDKDAAERIAQRLNAKSKDTTDYAAKRAARERTTSNASSDKDVARRIAQRVNATSKDSTDYAAKRAAWRVNNRYYRYPTTYYYRGEQWNVADSCAGIIGGVVCVVVITGIFCGVVSLFSR